MSAHDEDDDALDRESGAPAGTPPSALRRGVALGFLAMLPMLFVYEAALVATGAVERSTSELVLFRLFALLGPYADLARRVALVVAAGAALAYCLRRHWALGPALARLVAEGVVGAIVIGPLLIGLIHLLGDSLPRLSLGGHPSRPPDLAQAAFVFGAGAYEELVFRVGLYSAAYWATLRVLGFFGAGERLARGAAELVGLLGSSLLFSAFHLALFVAWLGPGGERFDAGVFTYRALAGILLGLVYRWRGPGVSAWTHGLFNLALLLGAGPDVFL